MSDRVDGLMARASEEVDVAAALRRLGYHEQAASRAYYAAFYAAEAALLLIGETRSKHAGVISAFGRLLIKDRGLDPELGSSLRILFERRNWADHDWLNSPVPADEDPIAIAGPFVAAVDRWIKDNRSA